MINWLVIDVAVDYIFDYDYKFDEMFLKLLWGSIHLKKKGFLFRHGNSVSQWRTGVNATLVIIYMNNHKKVSKQN